MWWLTKPKDNVKYLQLYLAVKNIERQERVRERINREECSFLLTREKDGHVTVEKLSS